jgi:PAS domain S-box-containing protein
MLVTIAVSWAVLAAGGAWFYRSQEELVQRKVMFELEAIAEAKVRQLEQWRSERLSNVAVLMERTVLVDEMLQWLDQPRAESDRRIRTAFQSLKKHYSYEDVLLVDAAGQVRLSLTETRALSPDLRQAWAMVQREQRLVFSDLHLSPEAPLVRGAIIAPLAGSEDATAAPRGAVIFVIDAQHFIYPVTQSWPTPTRTGETLFVRREGDAVLYLNALRGDPDAALKRRLALTQTHVPAVMAVLGQRGVVEGVDYSGSKVLAALKAIANSPWLMVTKIEMEEALEEWRPRAALIVAVLLLTGGGLAGTTIVIWQQRAKYRALAEMAAALRKSEEQIRLMVEGARDHAIFSLDTAGRVANWNIGLQRLYGYAAEEIIGRESDLFFAAEDRAAGSPARLLGEAAGQGHAEQAGWQVRRDGSRFWAEVVLTPLRDAAGGLLGYSEIARDISERKRAEAEQQKLLTELKRSNDELEQFAYVASHDLQEPLRMVASYTQLLAQRYKGRLDQDADDFIGYAVDGATRMQRLINDLLMYSRVGNRGQPLVPVESQTAFDAAVRNLTLAVEESKAVITHDPLPVVRGDEGQLLQLFQNLLGNALKFRQAAEPPRIHVSAQRTTDQWTFAVADNGIGIAPQFHERIFAIFQRLHSRKKYAGTGIGLALCRRVVERHQGRIWLESAEGRGTTFFFTLPAIDESHEPVRPSPR